MATTEQTELPPGPRGYPLLGNLFQYTDDRLEFVTRNAEQYGPVTYFEVPNQSFYQVSEPELVEHVLVQNNQAYIKGELFQQALGDALGDGLLTSEGTDWRDQRHRMQPAFHPGMLEQYSTMMTAGVERLLETWEDGETRDIHEDMMHLTVEIAAETLFDVDVRDEQAEVSAALEAIMDAAEVPVDIPSWIPTPRNRRYEAAIETLDDIADRIVEKHDGGRGDDIVTILLTAQGKEITRERVRDEIVTLLLAGHETTALTLTYTLHLLGRNPEQRERLQAELAEVLDGRTPTMADLEDLPYTEQTIEEGMRIYPPVWELIREAAEPDELGGYEIPVGATVSMQPWVIHRDGRFYDDPLSFRPERWTDEFKRSLPKFAYFPFGGGPRRCIGDRFAMLEARLVLATIAQEWTVEPHDDLSFAPSITLRPDGPVEMTVRRR
ncbi:cytochrome P450 [Haloarchaeobius sp. DYHT-AS-18]|uniref:cytochrome P450 n=1 Tax=Haloarchaeobius sp. DYHT-AS-18 TaxID=3446117 RepID=UPI003EC0CA91